MKKQHIIEPNKVKLKCSKCKKRWTIRTGDVSIYTEEVRDNWLCPLCSDRLKRAEKESK